MSQVLCVEVYATGAIKSLDLIRFRLAGCFPSQNDCFQGITVRSEERGLVIARILAGSMIDKQGGNSSFQFLLQS